MCGLEAKMVIDVTDRGEREAISRRILEALPDWFGMDEPREEYIRTSMDGPFFACVSDGFPVGFLCLKETGQDTVELHVMGVLREYQRRGLGTELFSRAREYALAHGYSFMQVKTVQMGRYVEYDATNRFYLSLGFKEFELFPTLWDEWNPCQVYVMYLKQA